MLQSAARKLAGLLHIGENQTRVGVASYSSNEQAVSLKVERGHIGTFILLLKKAYLYMGLATTVRYAKGVVLSLDSPASHPTRTQCKRIVF